MHYQPPSSLIASHWKFIFLIASISSALAVGASLFQPLEYRATVQLLVTPIISNSGVLYDQYTALKSAELVSETLSSFSKNLLFLEKVVATPGGRELDNFPEDPRLRRKMWTKKIDPLAIKGTGGLILSVYDTDRARAQTLARVVAETIISEGPNIIPGKIDIRIVDPPILSKYPVRPNLPLRLLFGFVFGGLFAGIYIYIRPHNSSHTEFRLMS